MIMLLETKAVCIYHLVFMLVKLRAKDHEVEVDENNSRLVSYITSYATCFKSRNNRKRNLSVLYVCIYYII